MANWKPGDPVPQPGSAEHAAMTAFLMQEVERRISSGRDEANNDSGAEDDPNWEHIAECETLVFQFQENDGASNAHLPYTLEVIWIHDGQEIFFANDADNTGMECSEKFVPLIEKAARKAKKLTSFMVRYNNQLDRTWPYTKVSRIAEVVSQAKGMEARLASVDEDYFEYIVNLSAGTEEGRTESKGNGSFASAVDFSHIDAAKRYFILDYIGGDAMELM